MIREQKNDDLEIKRDKVVQLGLQERWMAHLGESWLTRRELMTKKYKLVQSRVSVTLLDVHGSLETYMAHDTLRMRTDYL